MTWENRTETTRENRERVAKQWGRGPWDAEPDRVEWTTEAGLPGIILRQSSREDGYAPGHLCGYVGVEPGHPWHGRSYDSEPEIDTAAHEAAWFGITYGRDCEGEVCHVPPPGTPEHLWWVGFDAAHCDDVSPRDYVPDRRGLIHGEVMEAHGSSYKTIGFMRHHVEKLAAAAKAAEEGGTP